MATNDFLPFSYDGAALNYTNAEYLAHTQRPIGNQIGIADPKLVNKALRQSSIMSTVLAQYVSDMTSLNSVDDGTTTTLLSNLKTAVKESSKIGTNTNDNALAGQIGEYVSSTVLAASALALTTATGLNVTSISLTAGDWDVDGFIGFKGLATIGMLFSDFSTTSAIRSASPVGVPGFGAVFNEATYGPWLIPTTQKRISIAATTIIYLVAYANFSAGTGFSAYGTISARRAR